MMVTRARHHMLNLKSTRHPLRFNLHELSLSYLLRLLGTKLHTIANSCFQRCDRTADHARLIVTGRRTAPSAPQLHPIIITRSPFLPPRAAISDATHRPACVHAPAMPSRGLHSHHFRLRSLRRRMPIHCQLIFTTE